jgi:hypothetical protein
MDKKEIYEHLAKIYLDASAKKKKKNRELPGFKYLIFVFLALTLSFTTGLSGFFFRSRQPSPQLELVLQHDVSRLDFNFDPAKKEIYAIKLKKMDLNRFKMLAFALKKHAYQDNVAVRIEFANALNEKSEVYLKNISQRWQDYRIRLGDFKNISDWSAMTDLAFTVEEWNTTQKQGTVYVDNIRLLR